jgi:phage terminase small subunit
MCFALDGGVWLHRHRVRDEPMVHLVSADRQRLLDLGRDLGLRPEWIQYKPLKDPRTGERVPAWHWDVWGSFLSRLNH